LSPLPAPKKISSCPVSSLWNQIAEAWTLCVQIQYWHLVPCDKHKIMFAYLIALGSVDESPSKAKLRRNRQCARRLRQFLQSCNDVECYLSFYTEVSKKTRSRIVIILYSRNVNINIFWDVTLENIKKTNKSSWALVRQWTIPVEWPPHVYWMTVTWIYQLHKNNF
jgi:hypothetical protein